MNNIYKSINIINNINNITNNINNILLNEIYKAILISYRITAPACIYLYINAYVFIVYV